MRDFNLGGADAYVLSVVILGGTDCRDDDQACDGLDDDCDGIDEDALMRPTVCGEGTCRGEGF